MSDYTTMCFLKGTQVLSNEGYKNIEDITMDMKLATHAGRFQNIVNIQRIMYTGNMRLVLYNCHHPIICTEEQSFYVRTYNGNYTFGEPVWKSAKELTLNDYCGMVTNSQIQMASESYVKPEKKPAKGFCLQEKQVIASVDNNTCEFNTVNEYTWEAPVSFSTHTVENIEVYNLEVEHDNSYIVENLIVAG